MGWVRGPQTHGRCSLYYQDFGSTSAYRIQNYPASLAALSDALHHPVFPAYAPHFPGRGQPPPPGGISAEDRLSHRVTLSGGRASRQVAPGSNSNFT